MAETAPPSKSAVAAYNRALNMCRLGYSLGDQLDTPRPADGAPAVEWYAYDAAVFAEFEAAGLLDVDVSALMTAFYEVCGGSGEPKNA